MEQWRLINICVLLPDTFVCLFFSSFPQRREEKLTQALKISRPRVLVLTFKVSCALLVNIVFVSCLDVKQFVTDDEIIVVLSVVLKRF
jgi:hypothetical protein